MHLAMIVYFYWCEDAILRVLVLEGSWIPWDFMLKKPNGPEIYPSSSCGGLAGCLWHVLEAALPAGVDLL